MSDNPQPPPKRRKRFTPIKSALAFLQSAAFRDFAFAALLILVELVLAARYGADTYRMALAEHQAEWQLAAPTIGVYALAVLDVALIDGVFMLMLIIAKYAGQSAKASKIRPFAAIGGIGMFYAMLRVATQTMPVTTAARWAGGLLLLYIVSDILIDGLHRIGAWLRSRDSSKTLQQSIRASVNTISYIAGALVVMPLVLLVNILRAGVDYWTDIWSESGQGGEQPVLLSEHDLDIVEQMRVLLLTNPGLNQSQMARDTGYSRTTVRKYWDKAKAVPSAPVSQNGHGNKEVVR